MDSAASLAELLHCYGSTHTVSGLCRWRSLLCGAGLLLRSVRRIVSDLEPPAVSRADGACQEIACGMHTCTPHTHTQSLVNSPQVWTLCKRSASIDSRIATHSTYERMFITTISIAHLQNIYIYIYIYVGSYSSVDRHVYHQTNIPLAYVYAPAVAVLLNQQLFSASW